MTRGARDLQGMCTAGRQSRHCRGPTSTRTDCQSRPHSFRYIGGVATDQRDWATLEPGGNVVSFGEDGAGELYIVTRGTGIYRIAPR